MLVLPRTVLLLVAVSLLLAVCPWLTSVPVTVLVLLLYSETVVASPVISFPVSDVVLLDEPTSWLLTSRLAFCELVSVSSDVVCSLLVSVRL